VRTNRRDARGAALVPTSSPSRARARPAPAFRPAGRSLLALTAPPSPPPNPQPQPQPHSRLLVTGDPKSGYDLGSITSLGLTAYAWPHARAGNAMMTAMAALGGISSAGNVLKSYEMRTGKPRELEMRHR